MIPGAKVRADFFEQLLAQALCALLANLDRCHQLLLGRWMKDRDHFLDDVSPGCGGLRIRVILGLQSMVIPVINEDRVDTLKRKRDTEVLVNPHCPVTSESAGEPAICQCS